jgi:glutamine---fructose-6-phosphate transaminase (isomerizing)
MAKASMSQLEDEIAEIPSRLLSVASANRVAFAEAFARYCAAPPPALFTIARGSSDAVAAYAGYRLTPALNIPVGSFAPSLASLDGVRLRAGGLWTLAISQSGQGPDLIAAQAAFANSDGTRLALVNNVTSPLALAADIVLDQHAGEEFSIAATKTFACSLLAIDLLTEALCGNGEAAESRGAAISRAAKSVMASPPDLAALGDIEGAYVVGRGPTLPVATEAALKLKETVGLHAEAVSAAEVMHGPRAIAGRRLGVLGFAGPGLAGASVLAAVRVLAEQGSPTILVSPPDVPSAIAAAAPVMLIAGFYAALPGLARRRGQNPDQPSALSKVTKTL